MWHLQTSLRKHKSCPCSCAKPGRLATALAAGFRVAVGVMACLPFPASCLATEANARRRFTPSLQPSGLLALPPRRPHTPLPHTDSPSRCTRGLVRRLVRRLVADAPFGVGRAIAIEGCESIGCGVTLAFFCFLTSMRSLRPGLSDAALFPTVDAPVWPAFDNGSAATPY